MIWRHYVFSPIVVFPTVDSTNSSLFQPDHRSICIHPKSYALVGEHVYLYEPPSSIFAIKAIDLMHLTEPILFKLKNKLDWEQQEVT